MEKLSPKELTDKYGIKDSEGTLISFGVCAGFIRGTLFRLDGRYDETGQVDKYALWMSEPYDIGAYARDYNTVGDFTQAIPELRKIVANFSTHVPKFSLKKLYDKFFNFRDNIMTNLFKLGVFAFFIWGAHKLGLFSLFIAAGDALLFNPYLQGAVEKIGYFWNDLKYEFLKHFL